MQEIDLDAGIRNANKLKNIVLYQLHIDEIISDDEYEDYVNNWKVLIHKKSWFEKLVNKSKDSWMYKFFKVNNETKQNDIFL